MPAFESRQSARLGRMIAAVLLFMTLFAVFVRYHPLTGAAAQQTSQNASVRVLNASPGAPSLDLIVDGAPLVQGVAFGKATEYASISKGDHQIQFVPSGQGSAAAVIDKKVSFDAGDAHVLAVVNNLKDIELQDYKVNTDSVDQGKARARAINVAPGTDGLKIAVTGGDTLFDGLDFKDASDYNNQDPGTYDLDVKKGDDQTPLATAKGVSFQQGNVYDLFILGSAEGSDLSLISLVTSASPPCSALVGVGSPEDACVRVVHADAGAQQIDFLVNDSQIATGVAFGTASDFIAVPAGDDRKFSAVPVGGQPSDSLADETKSLNAGQAYEVILAGRVDDEDMIISEVDLSPLPVGQARLRMIGAAQDADKGDLAVTDGDKLFGGVAYKDVTDYKVVDADTYDLQFRKSGGDTVMVRATKLVLKEGMAYDLVLIGMQSDNSLQLISLEANSTLQQGGVATPVAGTPGAGAPIGTPEVVGTPIG
ncbi:MAG: DUF4397 domain-containing protein [Thermomicrobiales bacterium]